MHAQQPTGATSDVATNISLTGEQVQHLRTLLFEDLQQWAESLAEQAQLAVTRESALAGIDAMNLYRRRAQPTADLLNLIGWDTRDEGTA